MGHRRAVETGASWAAEAPLPRRARGRAPLALHPPLCVDEAGSCLSSQFGVLVGFDWGERTLCFHDFVGGKRLKIGKFSLSTQVSWYQGDVIVLGGRESFIRRASYMKLLEKPDVSTFRRFEVPICDNGNSDFQLSQYTGKMLYPSSHKLVILDLETMRAERTDIGIWCAVNTTCVLPEGMIGAVSRGKTVFFINENGRKVRATRVGSENSEAILSSSDSLDLNKALVKGTHWRIPERKKIIHYYDFEKRIGWFGNHFVRLVDDVFLFHGHWKDDGYMKRKRFIIRIIVP